MKKKPERSRETLSPDQLLEVVNAKFGYDVLNYASHPKFAIKRIPTGILAVDELLGGGFARGRYFEVYGGFSIGKTTLCLRLIANAQAQQLTCFWLDPEKSFDPEWAQRCGVDLENLFVVQDLDFGDHYFDVAHAFLRSGEFGVGICDSIASLYPQQEDEKPTSNLMPGTQARLMSKGLRKLTAANKQTVLGFINQTREKIGVMYGDSTTTPGGKAMGFYAGVRLRMNQVETLKETREVYDDKKGQYVQKEIKTGHRIGLVVEKNKTGGAKRHDTSSMVFRYREQDFDTSDMLFNLGMKYGLVKKKGNTFSYSNISAVGRDNFKKLLSEKALYAEQLEEEITGMMKGGEST